MIGLFIISVILALALFFIWFFLVFLSRYWFYNDFNELKYISDVGRFISNDRAFTPETADVAHWNQLITEKLCNVPRKQIRQAILLIAQLPQHACMYRMR